MAHVDALFKMIAIGDEGPVRTKLVEHLAYDSFSDEYAQTIGARIHVIRRSVSNIAVKIVLWEVFNNIGQLKQSYYQNTSMVIMTVSDSSQDACTRYQDLLTEVYEVVGKIPVALVVDEADPLYDADFIEIRIGHKPCNFMHTVPAIYAALSLKKKNKNLYCRSPQCI